MLKAVLFDLGGTLVYYDSAHASLKELEKRSIVALYRHLAANGQMALTEDTFLTALKSRVEAEWQMALASQRGGSVETPILAALADLGLSFAEYEWQAARQVFYGPVHQAAEPRLGAAQTLRTLRERGIALGLLSNTFWAADVHDVDLARFGLLDFLPVRLYSCDIGLIKPHPEAFEMALTALGVEPNETVYVGDRLETDVEPARRLGLWGVLISVPFRHEHSDKVMPDAVIAELPELIKLLEPRR
jgi:putative hydrolase of the HAD superfamily